MLDNNETGYNILVIDDNPGDRLIIDTYLNEAMHDVQITNTDSFEGAQDLLVADKRYFDIVLLDLNLPDMRGGELARRMLAVCKGIPIIVLTGTDNLELAKQLIGAGIDDYIQKDELNAGMLAKSIAYSLQRLKFQSAMQRSEKKYNKMFQLNPHPLWLMDAETDIIIEVNEAAIALYGYTKDEFLLKRFSELESDTPGNFTDSMGDWDQQQQQVFKYEGMAHHFTKAGNELIVDLHCTSFNVDQKELKMCFAVDVTKKVRTQAQVAKAIIESQENERKEIGSKLHDNISQILASTQMALGFIKDSIKPEALSAYELCKQNTALVLAEVNTLSHQLSPAFFQDTKLEQTLKKLFKQVSLSTNARFEAYVSDEAEEYLKNFELQFVVYRIIQELLTNIIKHSNASHASIEVTVNENALAISAVDDGTGFDNFDTNMGLGFANIRNRVEVFGGTIVMHSGKPKGFEVNITLPLLVPPEEE